MDKQKNKRITSGGLFGQPPQGNTVILMQPNLWAKDIGSFRQSFSEAIKIDFPSRVKLYDLYQAVLLDTHLTAVLEKRKAAVLSLPLEFSREGKPDGRMEEIIESPWFRSFLSDLLDTRWWGFSLFQFYAGKDGWLNYELVPRKHVDPVRKLILKHQTDIHGSHWDEFPDLLPVGGKRDLGGLAKAVPWVLYKQGTVGDWAQFCEIFGMPIREYVYNGEDDDERKQILNDVFQAGAAGVFLHPEGTNMNIIESSNKAGSSQLYHKMVETCNAEISKLILGNTLTTESSERGTQSLGMVQLKGEERILESDKLFILEVLNYDMSDVLQSFGFNVKGGKFNYIKPKNINLESRIIIDMQLAKNGLPIGDEYWYDTYGIPKPDNYEELKRQHLATKSQPSQIKEPVPDDEQTGKVGANRNAKNSLRRFF